MLERPYPNPTLAELRARVARELRDPNLKTFTQADLNDYINAGVGELNELRPLEEILTLEGDEMMITETGIGLDYIWRVMIAYLQDGRVVKEVVVPPANDETSVYSGWLHWGHRLMLPRTLFRWLHEDALGIAQLWVFGYYARDVFLTDDQVGQFRSAAEETAIRQYCMWRGWDALRSDRALFQQWQTQSNNTDISETQLINMAGTSEAEWSRTRKRIYLIRRPAVGW